MGFWVFFTFVLRLVHGRNCFWMVGMERNNEEWLVLCIMVGCSSCMVFMWNNNSLPKTKKMRKTITFKTNLLRRSNPLRYCWINPWFQKYVSLIFGIIFSFVGFVNIFWGNDPFFGLIIFALSFIYYLPAIDLLQNKIRPKTFTIAKYVVGFLILWTSLGVGELFDKVELMLKSFPYPDITGV